MTTIEWTDQTWNPILGCSKISEGCRNCYAINQAYRNWNMAQALPIEKRGRLAYYERLTEKRGERIEWTGKAVFVPEALEQPLKRKKPTRYFVNSMSDLFHESVTDEQLDQIFAVMALTPQHIYQVLTKRPERMLEYLSGSNKHGKILMARRNENIPSGMYPLAPEWPLPNVWLGVTVENQKAADERIPLLLQTPASVRFLSCEPLLEEVELRLWARQTLKGLQFEGLPRQGEIVEPGIDWVICGGESGHNARPCDEDWIRSIVQQCQAADVACFVKQLGSRPVMRCRMPDHPDWDRLGPIVRTTGKGGDINEFPEDLKVREFPLNQP